MAKGKPTIDEENEELEGEEEESSLRDDLESAIAEEEENEAEEETKVETEEEEGGAPEGEDGKPAGENIGGVEGDGIPAGINAPIGFSPEAREQWKDVPDVVKSQIQAREKQIEEAIANTGEYRRTHQAITSLAQSYAPILAAEGAETPMAAVEGLFRTVAELRVGTPQQTAQRMADLIGHYGIDIGYLDKALSGTPIASPEQTAMERMLEQRLKPFESMLQGQQEQGYYQQQQAAQAVQTELQEFASKPDAEFLNDVRHDMADLIELASKQGRAMSFEEAYRKACSLNPQIASVLEKRKADAALVSGKARANGKRNASSSVPARGANVSDNAGDKSLRGTITSIWDSYAE
jgi:hypothetical protein